MLQMTEFCKDLKDPNWDDSAQKIQHLAQEFPRTHFGGWWNILEKHYDVFSLGP